MCDTVDTPYKCGHKGIDRIVCGIKKKAQFEFQEVVLTMPVAALLLVALQKQWNWCT